MCPHAELILVVLALVFTCCHPALAPEARVVADWTVALFFRRDFAELGTLGHRERVRDV
jgi:hypothetical protein